MTAQWKSGFATINLNGSSPTTAGTATIYEKPNVGWYSDSTGSTSITEIPTMPRKTGYILNGFYTQANCQGSKIIDILGAVSSSNATFSEDTTLYACWQSIGITTMQAMTSTICNNMTSNATATLQDSRDNNIYTIFKGKDNKCWMSQNLKLIGKTITSSDSNVNSGTSFSVPNNNWASSLDSNEKYTNPYTYNTGDTIYGVYYNYPAASAGTISGTANTTETTQDICPKGWRLPSHTEQQALLTAYGITDTSAGSVIARSRPISLVFSGYVDYNMTTPSDYGLEGFYYSSTANSGTLRYRLYITDSRATTDSTSTMRVGRSIRCIAK